MGLPSLAVETLPVFQQGACQLPEGAGNRHHSRYWQAMTGKGLPDGGRNAPVALQQTEIPEGAAVLL
ncbi:hypothetical protein ACQKO5_18160 [Novosphingobium subterraneum]|uniref:hypothetical protein n=1 Tax=Novosphingobium TaxID=165696 RepID=UPI0007817911|nr:hypothetical protein [Novosphingobium sp. CCH12-A3]